jgi:hypothetical protein
MQSQWLLLNIHIRHSAIRNTDPHTMTRDSHTAITVAAAVATAVAAAPVTAEAEAEAINGSYYA